MPPRLPCLCPRCKGALVAERTHRRHASDMNVEPSILSFSAWASSSQHHDGHHDYTTQPRPDDPSDSANGHNDDAAPLKRLRTTAVGVR